jgi:hypothetical protein
MYPPDMPNLVDPDLQNELILVALSPLDGDPDFPVLVLARVHERLPQLLLVIVDARNGKDTWSLREDHAIFFVLFTDSTSVERAYLDEGFATSGKPSGTFVAAGPDDMEELMAKLRESRRRSSKLSI